MTSNQHPTTFAAQIAERIRLAREAIDMTQEEFSRKFDCKDRQTVSAIETGIRPVSPEELIRIAKILAQPASFFTDPYVVTEKNAFSYRAKANTATIDAFEKQAHKLISANRRFRQLLGEPTLPFGSQLRKIDKQTPLMSAAVAGERTARSLGLGEPTTLKLRSAVEEKLRINIFFVDAPNGISGAACHLPDGDYMLINRKQPSFRCNFDIGHELFHLLTWEKMPPPRIDEIMPANERPKVEKLADYFGSGLLMPSDQLIRRWNARLPQKDIRQWILATAKEFRVPGEAVYWRLINTHLLTKATPINLELLSRSDEDDGNGKPNRYNAEFVRRLHKVLDRGLVSVRKAAELLDCEPYDLPELVASYGFDQTAELIES